MKQPWDKDHLSLQWLRILSRILAVVTSANDVYMSAISFYSPLRRASAYASQSTIHYQLLDGGFRL